MPSEEQKRLQGLLNRLFQFESEDLDFGIYRIMNQKRSQIQKFIEKELIEAVDREFEKYSKINQEELNTELNEIQMKIKDTLGEEAITLSGDVKKEYKNSPIAKEYQQKKETAKMAEITTQQKAEIFSHIYEFFSRYYQDGDFISQKRSSRHNKYAIPYNGEEVLLHWVNKDQYYIKTGEYFKKYCFKEGGYNVTFKLTEAETNQNNTKSEKRFFIPVGEEPVSFDKKTKGLIINFQYRGLTKEEEEKYGKRNIQESIIELNIPDLLPQIPDDNLVKILSKTKDEKTLLKKHLIRYTKRNTTDFFIHKNLRVFLQQELDYYIKNEIFNLDDIENQSETEITKYLTRVKTIKAISTKIIEFLSQIEDFQKKLWKKKKFVLRTDYCRTLDKVPEKFYEEIIQNEDQINEWKELFKLEEVEKGTLHHSANVGLKIDVDYLKSHSFLVLDTKFFSQDFKDRLLATFEDLDGEIGGVMIKSENWQALNLLLDKYHERVKCIYIDPPFNTGSDDFIYKDNYQHSSWLTMMENRLSISKKLLNEYGIIYASIGDIEVSKLKQLMLHVFEDTNFISQLVWKKKAGGGSDARYYTEDHEYMILFAKNESNQEKYFTGLTDRLRSEYKYKDDNFEKLGSYKRKNLHQTGIDTDRPNLIYPIKCPDESEIYPPTIWRWEKARFLQALNEGKIDLIQNRNGKWQVFTKMYLYDEYGGEYKIKPRSILLDIALTRDGNEELKKLFNRSLFNYPKPSNLIKYVVGINTKNADIILDFFSGSGTTAHAVLNLNKEDGDNRKYILVEMGDYFDTVMKPRIQKVMFSKDWKGGKPVSTEGISHMFKYQYFEQYEDALENIEFTVSGTVQKTLEEIDGYFLKYMLDFESKESPTRLAVDKLSNPFGYKLKITENNETKEQVVDVVETFNYLLGLHVKQIKAFDNNGVYYRIVYGVKDQDEIAIVWRNTKGLDLKSDKEFIEKTALVDFNATKVYVNGDSYVEDAFPIEPEFKMLMWG